MASASCGAFWLGALCPALLACGEQTPPAFDECEFSASCEIGLTPGSIAWVDASHCVSPCGHPDESALVTVDADGAVNDAGGFRFAASAAPALHELLSAADDAGFPSQVGSAYRSYDEQLALWNSTHVTEPGRAARPGHSEHELGLALDVNATDAGYVWLAANAWRFGFALSFPKALEKVTGFRYEAWHFRYVGAALARELSISSMPLEEFLLRNPSLGRGGDCASCRDAASNEACSDDAAGECADTLLSWCFDGTETRVDCAASSLRCDSGADGTAACVP
ncbi:MAG TPA: M15 family metallopeptidase [Polyangiaceae bacterium]